MSRFQRDLSDSTVLRNLGVGLGHSVLAYASALKGCGRLTVSAERLDADLDAAWEVLAEPIQTVMRRHAVANPYEKLKSLTRGRKITKEDLETFVASLEGEVPEDDIKRMLAWTPRDYVGAAEDIALKAVKDVRK